MFRRDLRIFQVCCKFRVLLIVCMPWFATEQALALDPSKSITQYVHDAWQTKDGLPQSPIKFILQTHDGFLWLGTRNGLVRFDGLQFTIFTQSNTEELKSNDISAMIEDRDGNLWIGTNGGGLTEFKDGHWTNYSTAQGLPQDSVSSLYEDHDGSLWVATDEGVACVRQTKVTAYTSAQGLPNDVVRSIAEDGKGNLWVMTDGGLAHYQNERFTPSASITGLPAGRSTKFYRDHAGDLWIPTIGGGLGRLHDGEIHTYSKEEGLPSNFIFDVQEDHAGALWIGTGERLARFAAGRFTSYTTLDGIAENIVHTIYPDREGGLWLGTRERGLSRYFNGVFKSYGTKQGLLDNGVSAFYEDREGDLWVATDGGLERFKDGVLSTYTTEDGLSSDSIMSLYGGLDGSLWVGTNGGGLNRYLDGKFKNYTTKDGLSNDTVWALWEDRKGGLWIGTDNGLNHLAAGRFTPYTMRDGLSNNAISSLFEDHDGTLWIGTYGGGLNALSENTFKSYTTAQGLSDNAVLAIFEDRQNRLWIGTEAGLDQFKDGNFVHYPSLNNLRGGAVFALYEDEEHSLWIGTLDGLARFKDGYFTGLIGSAGQFAVAVSAILEDQQGNLWIGSGSGVHRASRGGLDAFMNGETKSISITSYGVAEGMKTVSCNGGGSQPAGWRTPDGRLWFATHRGLSVVDPNHLATVDQPLEPQVVNILFDYQVAKQDSKNRPPAIIVPAETRMLQIHYTAPSLAGAEKIRFKYKLEGFDRNWVDAGIERVASYTNLSPGNYHFRVTASSDGLNWHAASTTLDFYIQPHFYQTYSFYALCLGLFAFAGWMLYRFRLRQIEAQFGAVLAERNRMAREIHDTLAQGFVGTSIQLELVAKMMQRAPEKAREHLNTARELVRASLAEARRSVRNLRSHSLETRGLAAALAATARQMTTGSGISAEIETLGQSRPLSGEVENNLFRIGQEALTNSVKHARAQHIHIELTFERDHLLLKVRDDGCGFDPHQGVSSDGGFGLKGMRERVAQLNGELVINSQSGKGTEIAARVPTVGRERRAPQQEVEGRFF